MPRLLLCLALAGFAANSLLTRAAIGGGLLDAWTFMEVRLAAGCLALLAVTRLRARPATGRGSWLMAAWLSGYAVLFTLAYARIAAGPGALVLFGSVQLTMFASGIARGERLSPFQWLGVTAAVAGLLILTVPGLTAPDPLGAALMAGAGASWGAYSLAGRKSADPLAVTTDNFLRATVLVLPLVLLSGVRGPFTASGFACATASGALASGLGYAAWYAVLPRLAAWKAATVQLSVPLLTAIAAVVLLGEDLTMRLTTALALVVAGIWLATRKR